MNIQKLMKQAQQMQSDIMRKKDEFAKKEFEFSYQNDLVSIKMLGNFEVISVKINDDLIDKDDKETLEDLVCNAINQSIRSIKREQEELFKDYQGLI